MRVVHVSASRPMIQDFIRQIGSNRSRIVLEFPRSLACGHGVPRERAVALPELAREREAEARRRAHPELPAREHGALQHDLGERQQACTGPEAQLTAGCICTA